MTNPWPEVPTARGRLCYRIAKRSIGLIGAVTFLLLLSPVFLAVAIAIKLDSRGPVIFKQARVGIGGKLFTLYKFRSMGTDAEKTRQKLLHMNEAKGPIFKIQNDPRVTPVGRFLRRYSVDELPQIFNVLKGDMCFVGPRPPLPNEVAEYEPWQLRRLSVIPGITCLWQVSGRSNLTFEEWVQLDLKYIDTRSVFLDMSILLRTIPAVFSGKGAY